MTQQTITNQFNQAVLENDKYVKLVTDTEVIVVLYDGVFERKKVLGEDKTVYRAKAIVDGVSTEKVFEASANKLLTKLSNAYGTTSVTNKVKLSITRIGDKFTTDYIVKRLV
jgi:hypothetical protein